MADKEKLFVKGMYFEKPKEGTPEWIKGKISVKVEEFYAFVKKYEKVSGYVNIDLKKSKEGKYYLELNDWVPNTEAKKEVDPIDLP